MPVAYPVSPECEKFLRFAMTHPEIDKPVAVDDAYDLLQRIDKKGRAGRQELSTVCESTKPTLHEDLTYELNMMEQENVGPWVPQVLGLPVKGWDEEIVVKKANNNDDLELPDRLIERCAAADFEAEEEPEVEEPEEPEEKERDEDDIVIGDDEVIEDDDDDDLEDDDEAA